MAACSTGMIEIEGIPKSDSRFAEHSAKGNGNPTRVGRIRRSLWTEGVPKSVEKGRGILREPGPAFRGRAEVRVEFDWVSRHIEGVGGYESPSPTGEPLGRPRIGLSPDDR
jgi:hypothetical protein